MKTQVFLLDRIIRINHDTGESETIAVVEVIQNGEKHIEERIESVRKP